MLHSTTILALRFNDRAVMAGDGQVTLGQTVVKHRRARSAGSITTTSWRVLRARPRTRFALFCALRSEARAIPRQPRALGRRARARTGAPIARSAGSRRCCRRRRASDVPALGHRRPHRARRRRSSGLDRAARLRWPRPGRSPRHSALDARAIVEQAMAIAADICIYTNAQHRRSKNCEHDADLPARTHRPRRPTRSRRANRRRARQIRRRPGQGQARGRDRAAQPHAPAEAAAPISPKTSRRRTS